MHDKEICLQIAYFFFFQAEDGIRDLTVTGVQTCALPISNAANPIVVGGANGVPQTTLTTDSTRDVNARVGVLGFTPTGLNTVTQNGHSRSEEHTSELQSQSNLVCRLLLEKKKKYIKQNTYV